MIKYRFVESHKTCLKEEDNPYSQFLITIMAGVNQLERDLIRMRQREGIEIAKREGEMTVKQICEITNISRASIYRKLIEIKGLDSI